MKATKKDIDYWLKVRASIKSSTPVDLTISAKNKLEKKRELEADPQKWKEYFFPKYMKYESPEFHIKASDRLINSFSELRHWYEVRHWVRGLSKTTLAMMDVLYLVMTGKLKNIIYTSSTYDAAELFLERYRSQLDSNDRLNFFYGDQELPGSWSMGSFTTRNGVKFLALGAGQSPRGNGNEEVRPDCIIVDDFDTDEECMNIDTINKKWKWFENALFFTVDTAEPYLILWLGNIISEDCCVVRAGKMADYVEVINIRDENGKSVWPQKNEESDIDYQISKVSYASSQQELFNNPMREGQTFKEITWGKPPALNTLDYAVSYSDPSTSNNDKPTTKSGKQNSCKVNVLVGYSPVTDKFYIYKCFNEHSTNAVFIDRMYYLRRYVNNQTALYTFIENNGLQNPFFEQVLMPLVYSKAKEHEGGELSVTSDSERKGDKWFRVEADLEPLFRMGRMVFNEEEKGDPHMQRMAAQFISASITSKTLDGPDAVQGAVKEIKKRMGLLKDHSIKAYPKPPNPKRY